MWGGGPDKGPVHCTLAGKYVSRKEGCSGVSHINIGEKKPHNWGETSCQEPYSPLTAGGTLTLATTPTLALALALALTPALYCQSLPSRYQKQAKSHVVITPTRKFGEDGAMLAKTAATSRRGVHDGGGLQLDRACQARLLRPNQVLRRR